MWDLPGPGLEPVSLALAGGLLTTAPLGKSWSDVAFAFCFTLGQNEFLSLHAHWRISFPKGELPLPPTLPTLPRIQNHIVGFGFFWPCCAACGILVPQPGMEPAPSAVKSRGPNHWTAREFPVGFVSVFVIWQTVCTPYAQQRRRESRRQGTERVLQHS